MRVFGAFRAACLSVPKLEIVERLSLGVLIASAWLMPAAAQQNVFVDPRTQGDVIVDLSVLDELGPPPASAGQNTSQNLVEQNQEPIVLHPPGQKPAQKTASKASNPATKAPVANATSESSSAKTENTAKTATLASAPVSESKAPARIPPPAPKPAPTTPPTEATAAAPSSEPSAPVPVKPTIVSAIAPAKSKPEPSANAEPATEAPAAMPVPPPPPAAMPAPPSPPAATPALPPPPAPPPPALSASPNVAPQLASKPAAVQSAAAQPSGSETATVSFSKASTELSDKARSALDQVTGTLKKNSNMRIQLVAYASGDDAQSSQARRTSLIRGLAVRGYLIEHGISSSRIDVRALGNKDKSDTADRVDLVLSK